MANARSVASSVESKAVLARAKLSAADAGCPVGSAEASSPSPDRATRADVILQGVEQALTDPQGLPGRPWYRHLIYAPGYYTGYSVKTIPGVREAIEQRDWAEADVQIGRVAKALAALIVEIDKATSTTL